MLTYFMLIMGFGIKVIFAQWTSVTYGWIFAEVNALSSYEMIVSSIVFFSLPFLSGFFPDPSVKDLTITKLSVCACVLGILCMGFAPDRGLYIAAVTLHTLSCALSDSLRSFVTRVMHRDGGVGKGDIEKLYLGIGMVETVGGMLATAAWSGLFAKVIGGGYWMERTSFLGSAGVNIGVGVCVWGLGRYEIRLREGTSLV